MAATLKLTHKAIGVEVRRSTYDVVVDGKPAGSVEMNETIDIPVEPGRHTLQVRNGRNSSRTKTFDAAEGEIVAFRCSGKTTIRSHRLRRSEGARIQCPRGAESKRRVSINSPASARYG